MAYCPSIRREMKQRILHNYIPNHFHLFPPHGQTNSGIYHLCSGGRHHQIREVVEIATKCNLGYRLSAIYCKDIFPCVCQSQSKLSQLASISRSTYLLTLQRWTWTRSCVTQPFAMSIYIETHDLFCDMYRELLKHFLLWLQAEKFTPGKASQLTSRRQ